MVDYKTIEAFAAQNRDKSVLLKSSSGGIFYILAKFFLKTGGYVCGATYDSKGNVFHTIIDDIAELDKLLTSKYVRSKIGDCFLKIYKLLKENKKILFVGTPCQVSALDLFLKSRNVDKSSLLLVDFICHGTPDQRFWQKYLDKSGFDNIHTLNFRLKVPSWPNYSLRINDSVEKYQENPYMQYFLADYILTNPCYTCQYKGFNRNSDITLCDFWGHKLEISPLSEKYGISGVILNSTKSQKFLSVIKKDAFVFPCDLGDITKNNPSYFLRAEKPNDYYQKISEMADSNFVFRVLPGNKTPTALTFKSKIKKAFLDCLKKPITKEKVQAGKKSFRRIGVITDFGYKNFGNKLQNYALTKLCYVFGFNTFNLTLSTTWKNQLIKNVLNVYYSIKKLLLKKTIYELREKTIEEASKKYENKSFFYSYTKSDKKKLNSFDFVIFGSDQIWNMDNHGGDRKFVLGNFGICNEKFKKFSYAASVGTKEIADCNKPLFYQSLTSFYKISCREHSGTQFIKDLGFDCVTTLDPTLLLDAKDWDDAIIKFSSREIKNNDYVVLYFLKNATAKSEILSKCKKEGIKVIDLMDETSPFYISNQFDFINLIKNAQHVYTDSFHACVFSIIYGKSFSVYPRTDNPDDDPMFPRIENLFDMFGIKIDLSEKNTFSKVDFLHREKFENLKNFSYSYLKDCLLSGDK